MTNPTRELICKFQQCKITINNKKYVPLHDATNILIAYKLKLLNNLNNKIKIILENPSIQRNQVFLIKDHLESQIKFAENELYEILKG